MFCFLYSTGNNVKAPEELLLTEKESTPAKRIVYPSDQLTEECKRLMLGIDLQLEHAIKQGSLKLNQLWFANYLKPTVTEKKEDAARVTIFFRIVRRTETIDYAFEGQHLLTPKSRNRNQNEATHFVQQVIYGAEIICSIRKDVKLQIEKKKNIEDNICRAAKIYIDAAIKMNWTKLERPPAELDNISCQIFSSVDVGQQVMTGSFLQFCEWFRKNITLASHSKWKPVDIVLQQISASLPPYTLPRSETLNDTKFEIERKWHWICNESFNLVTQPGLPKIPLIEKKLCDFSDLLLALRKKFNSSDEVSYQKRIRELMEDITVWLSRRRQETEDLFALFKDNVLASYLVTDIEARPLSDCRKRVKMFIVKVDYKHDPLVENIRKLIGTSKKYFKWPVFTITSCGTSRRGAFTAALKEFVEDAEWCSNPNNTYQIGLVPSSSFLSNGTIKTIIFPSVLQESPSKIKIIQPRLPPPLMPIVPPKSLPTKHGHQLPQIPSEGPPKKKIKCGKD